MVQDFPGVGVSPSPRLSRLEENKWRLHLQRRMAGKEAEVHRVEWEFSNGTGFFRSFRLEREKRNTSEDFHLFQKLSGGMSCTIWVSNRNFRFLLTNGKRSGCWQHFWQCKKQFYLTTVHHSLTHWLLGVRRTPDDFTCKLGEPWGAWGVNVWRQCWPSGLGACLEIRRSRVQDPL